MKDKGMDPLLKLRQGSTSLNFQAMLRRIFRQIENIVYGVCSTCLKGTVTDIPLVTGL